MSLESRLRQGILQTASQLAGHNAVDLENALNGVRIAARRRQRLQIVAIGVAALAVALVAVAAPDIGRLLSIEPDVPPVQQDERDDDEYQEDTAPDRSNHVDPKVDAKRGGRDAEASFGAGNIVPPRPKGDIHAAQAPRNSLDGGTPSNPPENRFRTEEQPYDVVEPATDATACWAAALECDNHLKFQAEPQDRWISVTIFESQSKPVKASIFIDRDGDGAVDRGENDGIEFCTSTSSPIRILPGSPVDILVYGATCDDEIGEVSSGRVEVTFSTLRPR